MDPSSEKSRDQSRAPLTAWTSLLTATTLSAAATTNLSRYLSLLNDRERLDRFCDNLLHLLPCSASMPGWGSVLYSATNVAY